MTKTITNLWLDLVALVVMVGLMLTGGFIHFVLPPGTGHSHVLFGLGRHDYGTLHFGLAVAAFGLIAMHLAMHWSFVCNVIATSLGKEKPGARRLQMWGVIVLVVVVLLPILGIAWAKTQVQVSDLSYRGQRHSGKFEDVRR